LNTIHTTIAIAKIKRKETDCVHIVTNLKCSNGKFYMI
jgi:hypothetical protein